MTTQASVLFDAPGPRGRRLNTVITIVTSGMLVAVAAWILWVLGRNGQLDADKWTPFVKSSTWTTYLLPGLWGTLSAAAAAIALAMVVGMLLGVGRLAQSRWIRTPCWAIVEFFRSIPVLLLMIFAYQAFAVYAIVPSAWLSFSAVVFGLTLYNGSVIADLIYSGVLSLPSGQSEAAMALGMSRFQTMRMILLPQAITAMMPAIIAQLVIALKDSALGYTFGYIEVVRSGIQSASYYRNFLAALVVVAVLMFLINFALTRLAGRIQTRMRASRRR